MPLVGRSTSRTLAPIRAFSRISTRTCAASPGLTTVTPIRPSSSPSTSGRSAGVAGGAAAFEAGAFFLPLAAVFPAAACSLSSSRTGRDWIVALASSSEGKICPSGSTKASHSPGFGAGAPGDVDGCRDFAASPPARAAARAGLAGVLSGVQPPTVQGVNNASPNTPTSRVLYMEGPVFTGCCQYRASGGEYRIGHLPSGCNRGLRPAPGAFTGRTP